MLCILFAPPVLHLDTFPWISVLLLMNPFLLQVRTFLMVRALRSSPLDLETPRPGQGLVLDATGKNALVHFTHGSLPPF